MMPESKIEMILDEMMTENKKDTEMGHNIKITSVLKDFGVKSEDEFAGVLMNEWNIVVCKGCQNKIDIITAKYDSLGNIICRCGKSN